MPAVAESVKLPSTSSGTLTRSGENGHRLERQREEPSALVIKRDHRERPLEVDCPPIQERPLEGDCPPILERPLEGDCPPILERPLEGDCPPILESIRAQSETQMQTQEADDSPLLEHHHMRSPDEFTPEIHDQDNRGEYRFQCPRAGLFQCSITGLVFSMEGEGEVLYRTVPWDRRLLSQNGKRPAGPLFEFTCLKGSVCQLHIPHCEIYNSGGCDFLSVAHVTDDIIEFLPPLEITETHIIININGFSAYGEVKDEDSPTVPIRALVLLFYKPPVLPKKRSILNVLLLPRNAVIREVQEEWKRRNGDKDIYIETNPHCQLTPNQKYNLFTDLTDEYLIQPQDAAFLDFESYENYFPTFQLLIQTVVEQVNLLLKENGGEECVWERHVWLPGDDSAVSPTEVPSSGGATAGTTRNVYFLLRCTLAELVSKELEFFQWNLIHGVEGFTSIPRGQMENANRLATVDRIVQQYHDDGAVKITLEILRKMGQNKLADELEKKFTNNV